MTASADSARPDPITVEVIRNALVAIANEMKVNLMRSAFNPLIYEHLDFSVGIYNEQTETLAQASGLPEFLCDMPHAIASVLRDVGGADAMAEGDVWLTNDPYTSCFHTGDVTIFRPVFAAGALLGFAASRAHWYDLGARSAVATTDATEVYEEGLILKSIRLYERGRRNEEVVKVITANSRLPAASLIGDMEAQVGAAAVGEARLGELVSRYGREVVQAATHELLDQGERLARRSLANIPDGRYEGELWLDHDGVDLERPLTVKVAVTVEGTDMHIDLAGSSGPCRGPLNCNPYMASAACRVAFKSLTSPHEPANEGHFRPLRVSIPEESLFNARRPSSTYWSVWSVETLSEAVRKALASALPGRTIAGDYGRCCAFHLYGSNPESGFFAMPNVEGGGWGAHPDGDGEHVMLVGDIRNVPIEIMERKMPVLVERYGLRCDSGGPGRYRGGLGVEKDVRCLAPLRMVATFDRSNCRPWGLEGGGEGAGSRLAVERSGSVEVILQKCTGFQLEPGDVISARTGGGGGYGNSYQRRVEDVLADVEDGLVSVEAARRDYGVAIHETDVTVDQASTGRLRAAMATKPRPEPEEGNLK